MERAEHRNIGLPWITPPERKCDDPLCPWHGHLPVRGTIMTVTVEKVKSNKVAVVLHEYQHYVPKYKRYERRRRRKHVRVPPCIDVQPGDKVIIGETRPLAKSIAFVVLGKVRQG